MDAIIRPLTNGGLLIWNTNKQVPSTMHTDRSGPKTWNIRGINLHWEIPAITETNCKINMKRMQERKLCFHKCFNQSPCADSVTGPALSVLENNPLILHSCCHTSVCITHRPPSPHPSNCQAHPCTPTMDSVTHTQAASTCCCSGTPSPQLCSLCSLFVSMDLWHPHIVYYRNSALHPLHHYNTSIGRLDIWRTQQDQGGLYTVSITEIYFFKYCLICLYKTTKDVCLNSAVTKVVMGIKLFCGVQSADKVSK